MSVLTTLSHRRREARVTRLVALGAAVAASLAMLGSVGAVGASASASGYTYTGFASISEYVCGEVTGTKLNVRNVRVIRGKFPESPLSGVDPIVDFQGRARVKTPAGKTYVCPGATLWGNTWLRQYVDISLVTPLSPHGRTFPHNSRILRAGVRAWQVRRRGLLHDPQVNASPVSSAPSGWRRPVSA